MRKNLEGCILSHVLITVPSYIDGLQKDLQLERVSREKANKTRKKVGWTENSIFEIITFVNPYKNVYTINIFMHHSKNP